MKLYAIVCSVSVLMSLDQVRTALRMFLVAREDRVSLGANPVLVSMTPYDMVHTSLRHVSMTPYGMVHTSLRHVSMTPYGMVHSSFRL